MKRLTLFVCCALVAGITACSKSKGGGGPVHKAEECPKLNGRYCKQVVEKDEEGNDQEGKYCNTATLSSNEKGELIFTDDSDYGPLVVDGRPRVTQFPDKDGGNVSVSRVGVCSAGSLTVTYSAGRHGSASETYTISKDGKTLSVSYNATGEKPETDTFPVPEDQQVVVTE